MDLVLALLRRAARRVATVAVVLYASTGLVAVAQVCMPRPHTHHGVAAPDCLMHHGRSGSDSSAAGHTGHHATADDTHAHHAETAPGTPAMNCACGQELQALHPVDAAVPAAAASWSPSLTIATADTRSAPRLPTFDPQSSSPPPRA